MQCLHQRLWIHIGRIYCFEPENRSPSYIFECRKHCLHSWPKPNVYCTAHGVAVIALGWIRGRLPEVERLQTTSVVRWRMLHRLIAMKMAVTQRHIVPTAADHLAGNVACHQAQCVHLLLHALDPTVCHQDVQRARHRSHTSGLVFQHSAVR